MKEQIRTGLEQLRNFLKREKLSSGEIPHYIDDDYDLLYYSDGYLHNLMDRETFQHLQASLQNSEGYGREVVDIGASNDFLRGIIFLDASKTIAIDPAYKWYDYKIKDDSSERPYPYGVFGGTGNREQMEENLHYACRDLKIPVIMNQDGATLITGERKVKQRTFELLPEDANVWLLNQKQQSIDNFVVYRVFPSPSAWGKVISTLKDGGILITTGYGKWRDDWVWSSGEKPIYDPDISQGGGVDVDNSPLPANGNSEILGLISIARFDDIHFYKKIHHLEPTYISQAIINNQ